MELDDHARCSGEQNGGHLPIKKLLPMINYYHDLVTVLVMIQDLDGFGGFGLMWVGCWLD